MTKFFCRYRKLYSVFVLLLLVFTVASTTLHWHANTDSGRNSNTCSICLIHSALSSALLPAPILPLQKIVLVEALQNFYESILACVEIFDAILARGPPLT